MRLAAILVLASCLCAPLAVAAPLDFVESADLANVNSGSVDVGTFDVGVNTVVGSVDRGAGDTADF